MMISTVYNEDGEFVREEPTELDKKWENAIWDTDVYLDELDGKEPMTNEEWFCQLPTEEKAKVIIQKTTELRLERKWSERHIIEWLKQPHREEQEK